LENAVQRAPRAIRKLAVAAILCLLAAGLFPGDSWAATVTLTFKEPVKGSTFVYVDKAPKGKSLFGIPLTSSPGDEIIQSSPLEVKGKRVGKLRAVCTATRAGSNRNLASGEFMCEVFAKVPGGALFMVSPLTDRRAGTEGAVTGGTGIYAGATGTFLIEESQNFSTNTITLLTE
jgi:hypothetical protein